MFFAWPWHRKKQEPKLAKVLRIVDDTIGPRRPEEIPYVSPFKEDRSIRLLRYFDECDRLGCKPKQSFWNRFYGGDPDNDGGGDAA